MRTTPSVFSARCRNPLAGLPLAAVFTLATMAPAAADEPGAMLQVAPSAVELAIAVELPADTTVDTSAAWQLIEEDGDLAVPAQIGAAPDGDGAVAAGRQQVLAVIPPGGTEETPRRFRLVRADDPPAAVFEWTGVTAESLAVREGEQPVFVYNHGVITREDLPHEEHRRSRACYIHPLYGISGEVLTDDFPDDHYHHHGVFWTWPHVLVEGRHHDLWAGDTIHQRFVRWLVRETGPVAAVVAVENGWYVGDDQVMVERVWMRAFRSSSEDRAVDVELFFTPLTAITLQGAEGKSYGGLTVRFAPGPRPETVITVPSGPTTEDLPDTPLAWADFTSRFEGMAHRSGAAIFVPPQHPDFPPTWLTRYYGPLCIGWPGVMARTFEPGDSFALDYRLWIHREAVELDALQEAYRGYARATEVGWE